ncbi:MAG: hypothetical protein ACTHOE_05745 [Conexibacter sp.]
MSKLDPQERQLFIAEPTMPSPMIGHRGAPPGAPPIPWHKYIFYIFGFPVRRPRAEDHWRRIPRLPER